MQKQQNTYYTDMELEKIKHMDVAHSWLQDEVKSNRLRIRRVKSEANLVDIGTKAISNKIIRKHAISMRYVDALENLKTGGVIGLWIEESERADQSSSAQQKTSLELTGGHARQRQQQRQRGQPSLAEVTKRDDSKPGAPTFCGPCPHKRIVMDSCSPSHVDFLRNWSVASTKFLADDDVVVEATESDAAVRGSDTFNPSPLSFFRSLARSLSGTLALALSLFRFFLSFALSFSLSLSVGAAHRLGTVTLVHIPFACHRIGT